MAKKIKNGLVTIEVPEHLYPDKKAGTLTTAQVIKMYRPRAGLGVACDAAAEALDNKELKFVAPEGITAEKLRKAGARAEGMDNLVINVEALLEQLKQANLIADIEAFDLLSQINDQVKAQGKRNKAVTTAFAGLNAYFKIGAPKKKKQELGG